MRSLSGRLLVLTLVTVVAMEALILGPAISRFRSDFLNERLRLAQLASLAILATPEGMLDERLERELLTRAGAASIVLRRDGARALVLNAATPKPIEATYDLRASSWPGLLGDAARLALDPTPRHIRVIGRPYRDLEDEVEITMDDAPLRAAMFEQGRRLLGASLAVSLTIAALIFILVRTLLVLPIQRLTRNMALFRDDPEDAGRIVKPSSRVTEIAVAERALQQLQTQVREALREKGRLAALGRAVAKISHDLRNILSSAQLRADSIELSRDPVIQRAGPKLIAALDRAIRLCESTLRYGGAEEAPPVLQRLDLRMAIDDVIEQVYPEPASERRMAVENAAPRDVIVLADPEHLFRILSNLARNAREALAAVERPGMVRIAARRDGGWAEVDVRDDGPGLPPQALEHLFQPFRGGARRGGFGLGLAIAHELAALQGGALRLVSSDASGACFRLSLPLAPPDEAGAA